MEIIIDFGARFIDELGNLKIKEMLFSPEDQAELRSLGIELLEIKPEGLNYSFEVTQAAKDYMLKKYGGGWLNNEN